MNSATQTTNPETYRFNGTDGWDGEYTIQQLQQLGVFDQDEDAPEITPERLSALSIGESLSAGGGASPLITVTRNPVATVYINPTTREVMNWYDAGLCSWCGHKCGSGSCRARRCDCCTSTWLADTEADYDEFDSGGQATVAPPMEDCPPCVKWLATAHLENPAASFAPGDWMEVAA